MQKDEGIKEKWKLLLMSMKEFKRIFNLWKRRKKKLGFEHLEIDEVDSRCECGTEDVIYGNSEKFEKSEGKPVQVKSVLKLLDDGTRQSEMVYEKKTRE